MRALLLLSLAITACSFSGSEGSGGDTCTTGFFELCNLPKPESALTVSGTRRINTSTDRECHVITQTDGPEICVRYFTSVNIPPGAALIAHGSRAFALVAQDTITISGTLDVSSHRQPPEIGAGSEMSCAFGGNPDDDIGGSGGGAGGTYATQGGAGGVGDLDESMGVDNDAKGGIAGAAVAFSQLRGGCPGQTGGNNPTTRGVGGRGGGAVYVSGNAVVINGSVLANGGGGGGGGAEVEGSGGGGGGSGGTIVIEGFVSVSVAAVTGTVVAIGAGGGQGGDNDSFGEDGSEPNTAAAAVGGNAGGNGGNGGAGSTTDVGAPGTSDNGGGGGGGGGGGFIRILSPAPTTAGASIAPVPTIAAE